MLWLEYIDLLRFYRRVLKHRNMALKTDTFSILDTLDEQLAHYGHEIMAYRKKLSQLFAQRFPESYERVSRLGTEVAIHYVSSWPEEASVSEIIEVLAERRSKDIEAATSLSGPHRDRWIFIREGRNFSTFASTGQLRLASLILRIVRFIFIGLSGSEMPRFLSFFWMMSFWNSMWPRDAAFFRSCRSKSQVRRLSLLFYRKSHGTNMPMILQ